MQRQRDDEEEQREAALQRERDAQRVLGVAVGATLCNRAREQLFDGPVDHRDHDEHHRPQHVQALGRFFAEHVGGDREVGERQQPGGSDPHGEEPRAAAVGAGRLAGRGLTRCARRGNAAVGGGGRGGGSGGDRGGVGVGRGHAGHWRRGEVKGARAASSTGRASAPRRPSRGARAGRTKERRDQWLRCPGVLPSSRQ